MATYTACSQRRPDSGPANLILIALLSQNVLLAQQFRARVFEALWAEGLDISNDGVIAILLAELGIDMPQIASNPKAQLAAFQRQWQAVDSNRRIPIMTASDGRSLIGLSAPRDIECFLSGRKSKGEPSGMCEFVPRPVVLDIGHPTSIWHLIDVLQPAVDLLVAAEISWALRLIDDGLRPDLLLPSLTQDDDAVSPCNQLQEAPLAADIPIMVIDQDAGPTRELQFLQSGAAGYFQATADPQLFNARVHVHLTNKNRRDHLQETVRLDSLTGIPNRRELEGVLEVEWRRAIYSKLPLTVALFDVDHFKNYNDTYGHQAGDQCLIQITIALRDALRRDSDFVARYSGEEFLLVLPDCTQVGVMENTESCRREVELLNIPHSGSSAAPVVTISVGLTTVMPRWS